MILSDCSQVQSAGITYRTDSHNEIRSRLIKGIFKHLIQNRSFYSIIPKCVNFKIQDDSKLLSGFPWPIYGNPDNILESFCISKYCSSSYVIPYTVPYIQSVTEICGKTWARVPHTEIRKNVLMKLCP
jgi:hypothetical protein